MPSLVVKNGPNKGMAYEIQDESLGIGRDDTETIQIFDQGVSRQHAEIFRIGEMFFIRDLQSRNGTFVNEDRISEELLRAGDRIRIGSTEMVFEDKAAPSDRLAPQPRDVQWSHEEPSTTIEFRLDSSFEDEDLAEPAETSNTKVSQDLKTLYRLARVISEEREADGLMRQVVKVAGEAVEADHAYIFVKSDKGDLRLKASYERGEEEGAQPHVSRNIIKRVIKFSRAVLTSDATLDDRFSNAQSVVLKAIRSVVCAPLVALDELAGVLYVSSSTAADAFDSDDLELITAIAIQSGVAIQSLLSSQRHEESVVNALRAIGAATEMAGGTPAGRAERSAVYAAAIAGALKLSRQEVRDVQVSALLADIGLAAADPTTGMRPDPRQQAELAAKVLSRVEGLEPLVPAIRHAGERYDGAGTPDGLKGEDIPLAARVVACARGFDAALSAGGPGGVELSTKEALMRMEEASGGPFDSRCVKALMIAHRTGTLFAPEGKLAGL
ncbi:MAG: FHA domain-containing protein [Planctomycetes bacterium]|nr:FHA domain-containing protein [Planctomycetota bacterium]